MSSDREKIQLFCEATYHKWVEGYYGYTCENCGDFIPYGCEPWIDDDGSLTPRAVDLACTCANEKPYLLGRFCKVCGGFQSPSH